MSSQNEEILQVISFFRHTKRYCYINLDICQGKFQPDLCEDWFLNTTNKGKEFINKYFTKFSPSPFNEKDFKCFISSNIRTIISIIYRLIDFIPQADFKSMDDNQLKEYTLKNIPNAIYDDKIFNSYLYGGSIAKKYCNLDSNYKNFFTEIETEISKKSPKALELFKKYLELPMFKGKPYEYFKLYFVYDFLIYINPEVQKNFTEEQKILRDTIKKFDTSKRLLDVFSSNKTINLCFLHQLICNCYQEMEKIVKNSDDKKKIVLFSGHDIYLSLLVNFLEIKNNSKYKYYFDDEINFIIFKKKNDKKLYFRAEYNNEVLEIPYSTLENKKECELDTIMDKIKKEYLSHSYEEIMKLCNLKNTK